MPTIYLDNNVFISIQEKRLGFDTDIIRKIITSKHLFFYSAAHIQEARRVIENPKSIEIDLPIKRFKLISLITRNNYLYIDINSNDIIHIIETPEIVYETIHLIKVGQSILNSMANWFDEGSKNEFRDQNMLDSKQINNLSPVEIINLIESVYKDSIKNIIEKSIKCFTHLKGFGGNSYIAATFELLDYFGYWKDGVNEKSNYARLWDANHTIFASTCNYFVSDDKRTRKKAEVVYYLYNIGTKIIDSSEFRNLIIAK